MTIYQKIGKYHLLVSAEAERLSYKSETLERLCRAKVTQIDKRHEENFALIEQVERLQAIIDKQKWQPIESAPKDGTRIILSNGYEVGEAYYSSQRKWIVHLACDPFDTKEWDDGSTPTHWMSLPEPPKEGV